LVVKRIVPTSVDESRVAAGRLYTWYMYVRTSAIRLSHE
jgi:hypothetical protein